jgi:alkylation response protein AidB-like acyl-CoA dehydrogenase
MPGPDLVPGALLAALEAGADRADREPAWPAVSWAALRDAGVLGWCIPKAYAGQEHAEIDLLTGYERLAGACLTSCFILSQREAACRRIRDHAHELLRQELLPPLARGERFATVGLSHLTTSRQHLQPAVVARDAGDRFIWNGTMPWVTGAARADHFVTGAVLEDGRQILAVLPRDLPGITVGPPLDLMALAGSLTAEVRCTNVSLDRRWLLAGPAERVLASDRGGTGGLETSCLALGLAGAAVADLHGEAAARPELRGHAERLDHSRGQLRQEMHRLATGGGPPEAAVNLRGRANALVLRATQAALTASKGTGFVHPHPAQRRARQAMFFLVWSCPRPAAEATLAYLTPGSQTDCFPARDT